MAKTETQKSVEAYRTTRKDYLQKRVSEIQESLRTSGLSDKRKKKLQEQLKTFKDNLTKIKEQSSLKETKMAKQSLKEQYRKATTAGTGEPKVITTAAPGNTKGNGKPQSKRNNPSLGKRPNPNVGERPPRFFEANRFADKYRTAYKDYQNGDISEEEFKTVTDKMDSYKDAVDTDFIKNSIARENGPLPATKKPATKPKSNPSSAVDLPNAKMRELNNRLIESREKLSGLSKSTINRTKIKALKDSIFWDELDLLGYYEKLTPAKQKALDITKIIPADNIAKILKADKDNEFEKLKASHPELLKAPRKDAPKPAPAKKVTKPTDARDNVADIKKYALNLVNTKEESRKTSLRNTIAEIYGSLTASERKKLNLGTYVSKVDLKKMSANNTAVKKYMDSPTAFLQSAAEVRHAFAKDKKVAESKGRKPIAPKVAPAGDSKSKEMNELLSTREALRGRMRTLKAKGDDAGAEKVRKRILTLNTKLKGYKGVNPNANKAGDTDANGKRYTKRGVTQMLKQLREQQEKGRKTSNAYKQREEDIKRLTKVLKTLSSANPTIALADKHRITVIANSLEVVTANTVWGTGATYDELAKALKKIGIKGVTADGLEGDFDEGDGVTSGSEPVYKYFDKLLGEDDSEELAGADGAFVFATLYIAGLLGEDELTTVVPNANIRKLILKCGKKKAVSAARDLDSIAKDIEVAGLGSELQTIKETLKVKVKRGNPPVLVQNTYPISEKTLKLFGKKLAALDDWSYQDPKNPVMNEDGYLTLNMEYEDEDGDEILVAINQDGEIYANDY